jgi:pimeloyl-ACP methyl ester carboxylesterase
MELDHHRSGSGEPLVLVHGIGHTWRGWKPMLPTLERSFDVLAIDLPGMGYSPPLPAGTRPTAEALADAVEGAMDDAGFERAHVAGNSLGGWITLELARRGRAITAIPISPAGLQHGREKGWGASILRGMRWATQNAPTPEPLLRHPVGRTLFAGPAVAKPWRADPDDMVEEMKLFGDCTGFDETLDALTDCQPCGLEEIRCPVLILWGTRDVILLPRQGRRFERLIPGCELRYLRGLGHVPMADDPDLLARSIEEFAYAHAGAGASPAGATA